MNLITPPLGAGIGSLDGRYVQSGGVTFTTGSVLFANSSGFAAQNNANLFWDNTNNRLGIRTASPGFPLTIVTAAGSSLRAFAIQETGGASIQLISTATLSRINEASNSPLLFTMADTEVMRITSAGNVGIGTTSPSTYMNSSNIGVAVANIGAGLAGQISIVGNATANDTNFADLAFSNEAASATVASRRLSLIRSSRTTAANSSNLEFWTSSAGTIARAITIDSAGNVGIGMTNPQTALGFSSGSTGISLYNTTDVTTNFERVRFLWNANVAQLSVSAGGTGAGRSMRIGMEGSSASTLFFMVGGSDRWSITNAGNLVAGTDSASSNIILVAGSDIRPTSDSTTALNIANAAGTDFVTFNTTNNRVGIGTTGPGSALHVVSNVDSEGITLERTSATTGSYSFGLDTAGNFKFSETGVSARMTILKTSGNVGIGTASPNANAILDVSSTTKAFMPPRMTTTQRDAIASPTAGMVVYNSTTNKLNVYTTAWEAVTSA